MTPQEKAQMYTLLSMMEEGSMDYHSYNPDMGNFDENSVLDYDADMYGNMHQDDAILNIGGPRAAKWAENRQASTNLSTYRVRIFFTPVDPVPTGVEVILFASAFNTGTFVGGNLVFTNVNGDTATIQGLGTTNFQGLMEISDNEPFKIEFLRIRPKSETQLENPIQAFENSQWNSGSFNEISPDDYITPDQFQLLRSDTPLAFRVGQKRGYKWFIDTDQTGKGVGIVHFVSAVVEPGKALDNKPMVRKYGVGTPFFTSQMPANALENLIAVRKYKQLSRGR